MSKELKYPKAIYNWPEDERPRERLIKLGSCFNACWDIYACWSESKDKCFIFTET